MTQQQGPARRAVLASICVMLASASVFSHAQALDPQTLPPATWDCVTSDGRHFVMRQQVQPRLTLLTCSPRASEPAQWVQSTRPTKSALIAWPSVRPTEVALFDAPTVQASVATPLTSLRIQDGSMLSLIQDISHRYGHDPALIKAVIHVESRFRQNAVSPKGAVGLMQLMPATAARYGWKSGREDLSEPALNIRIGAAYLRDLLKMFPEDPLLALAAYNAGEGAVQRHGRRIPPYRETQNYVRSVMATYDALKKSQIAAR